MLIGMVGLLKSPNKKYNKKVLLQIHLTGVVLISKVWNNLLLFFQRQEFVLCDSQITVPKKS